MGKITIDRLRKEIARLEEEILKNPCNCGEVAILRKELKEHKEALERQEQELARDGWR